MQAAQLQLAQRLVGVHQRQAQAVGDVLLRQWKGHAGLLGSTGLQGCCALEELDQQGGDALFCVASADRQQVVVHQ